VTMIGVGQGYLAIRRFSVCLVIKRTAASMQRLVSFLQDLSTKCRTLICSRFRVLDQKSKFCTQTPHHAHKSPQRQWVKTKKRIVSWPLWF
jgi:hypothetical protein